jgi:glutamate-5-semialdehyde dehydrogenase
MSLTALLQQTKIASQKLSNLSTKEKNAALKTIVKIIKEKRSSIDAANKKDVALAQKNNRSNAYIDRLTITPKRFAEMLHQTEAIARLKDPIGEIIEKRVLKNGVLLVKTRVPLGVIGIIYESRPNVTLDVAALCLKSGNACVLKGGSDCLNSNRALVSCIHQALQKTGIPKEAVTFLDTANRSIVLKMLKQNQFIDVLIPRGGYELVRKVAEQSTIPLLYHAQGGARIYVDESANIKKAVAVCVNAKINRPGTCNSLDTILVHKKIAKIFLPLLAEKFLTANAEIRGDAETRKIIQANRANEVDFKTEFLSLIVSIKIVNNDRQAIDFITRYSKKHSEGIVAENKAIIKKFTALIDAAALFINCSTRLHDGGVFGLGAEMGIATGKLHARGPVGLRDLATYKWVVYGNGEIRK